MTVAQVADWMRAHGIAEGVIADEAAYIAEHYADPDEDPIRVLEQSLGTYLQRSRSGGERADSGYSTDLPDPAVQAAFPTTSGAVYEAPARSVSLSFPPPITVLTPPRLVAPSPIAPLAPSFLAGVTPLQAGLGTGGVSGRVWLVIGVLGVAWYVWGRR